LNDISNGRGTVIEDENIDVGILWKQLSEYNGPEQIQLHYVESKIQLSDSLFTCVPLYIWSKKHF